MQEMRDLIYAADDWLSGSLRPVILHGGPDGHISGI